VPDNDPVLPWRRKDEAMQKTASSEHSVATDGSAAIPVDVAAKIANDMIIEALSGRGRFAMKHADGNTYTRWALVGQEIRRAFEKVSEDTIVWNGQFEPENERRVRLVDERCRDWPEPAKSEAISILANGCLP